jgi:M6 family metalloprotease-like protein
LNNFIFGSMILILTATTCFAMPAAPDPFDIHQSDGSTVRARLKGDEFQNWTESDDTGHTIIRNPASNSWEYAEQLPDGSLRPNGQKVRSKGVDAPGFIPKGLKPPRNKELENSLQQHRKESYQQRKRSANLTAPQSIQMGAPATAGTSTAPVAYGSTAVAGNWVPVPVSGSKNLLIVLVSFANQPMQTTPAAWNSIIFDPAAKSVEKYYRDNSYGKVTIAPAAHTQAGNPSGIVSVTVADNHPNFAKATNLTTETTISNHALAQVASFVNLASFDTNGNGVLEQSELTIYFVYAGYEASLGTTPSGANSIWAHASASTAITGGAVVAGTKTITHWAQSGELGFSNGAAAQMPMGVIAHELGHDLCGLVDLYDISFKNQGIGNFSLMGTGSWGADTGETIGMTPVVLDTWSREFLGWSTPVVQTAAGVVTLGDSLSSASTTYKLEVPATSVTEYFLVENRQPIGWDLGLKTSLGSGWTGGLLVTHIDITAGTVGSNDINSYTVNATSPGHQGVVPVQASTTPCDMLSIGAVCRGDATTLFYTGNNSVWSALNSPNSNYYSSNPTYFSLAGISAPGSAMTANLTLPLMRTISVSKSGVGTGIVTSTTPAGIACGATCSAALLDGTATTLTAVADPGFVFADWTGAGCSVGNCQFFVNGDASISASFVVPAVSESFEKVTIPALPLNWSSVPDVTAAGSTAGVWTTSSSTAHPAGITPHSGANLVYFNSFLAANGNSAALVSSPFSLSGTTNGRVKFWMYRENVMSIYPDYVEVYVNTAGSLTGATLIGTVNRATSLAPAEAADGWHEYSFVIPATYSGSSNYILLKGISRYGNDIHIDDVAVYTAASSTLQPPSQPATVTTRLSSNSSATVPALSLQVIVFIVAGFIGIMYRREKLKNETAE